ncbi:MAG: methionine biosynthesis protein MetW [Candidatus Glassbacteria bacterium]|nr:methionine biosynthesis protein MetW [Candidatus Glassbacteria bacterium]
MEKYLAEQAGEIERPRQPVKRWDHEEIERIITPGSLVLDLGCGNGELLFRLVQSKGVRGQGVELDPEKVFECVEKGVSVFQTDLDEGLKGFPDDSFDFVILEETLQTVHQPVRVLAEMLRVGKQGVVSFPNFGYWRVRLELAFGGRMPVIESLPYQWYDTPNIHLFTIDDFLAWTAQAGAEITEARVLAEGKVRPLQAGDNLFAREALMVVRGKRTS